MIRRVDACERHARKVAHSAHYAEAARGAGSVAGTCPRTRMNHPCATSIVQTSAKGAMCSKARLIVVWSVTQLRAFVKEKTTPRNSAPAATIVDNVTRRALRASDHPTIVAPMTAYHRRCQLPKTKRLAMSARHAGAKSRCSR